MDPLRRDMFQVTSKTFSDSYDITQSGIFSKVCNTLIHQTIANHNLDADPQQLEIKIEVDKAKHYRLYLSNIKTKEHYLMYSSLSAADINLLSPQLCSLDLALDLFNIYYLSAPNEEEREMVRNLFGFMIDSQTGDLNSKYHFVAGISRMQNPFRNLFKIAHKMVSDSEEEIRRIVSEKRGNLVGERTLILRLNQKRYEACIKYEYRYNSGHTGKAYYPLIGEPVVEP